MDTRVRGYDKKETRTPWEAAPAAESLFDFPRGRLPLRPNPCLISPVGGCPCGRIHA